MLFLRDGILREKFAIGDAESSTMHQSEQGISQASMTDCNFDTCYLSRTAINSDRQENVSYFLLDASTLKRFKF